VRVSALVGSIAANAAVAGLIALVTSLASHDAEPERKPEPVDIVQDDPPPPPKLVATVDDPPPKLVEPVPPRPHPRRSAPAQPRGGHAPGSLPSPPTEPMPTPDTTAAGSGSGSDTGDGHGSGTGSGDGSGSGAGDPGIDRSSPPIPLDANPPRVLPYTTDAMRDRVAGDVQLVLAITADGKVGGVTVRRGLGHGLDEVAANIARGFRFRPALDHAGKPTTGSVRWRFHFAPP
jgi:TonB family protein